MTRSELVTVGDLKNWGYCPRVVFYRRFLPTAAVPTHKMKAGAGAQEMVERLEVRRSLAKYGFEHALRRFGVWLVDEGLDLSGRVDLLLEKEGEGAVVDFKLTSGEPGENHILQLAGYAALVEAQVKLRVARCFLVRIPDEKVYEIVMDGEVRGRLREALAGLHRMVEEERCPEATAIRGRCEDCEYANFCGDVW